MLDIVIGALLVVLVIRGWMRGLVREVLGLVVIVVGTLVAFRLSTPTGRVIASMSGSSPDAARVAAGIIIFLAVSVGAAIVSRLLHRGIRALPGLSTLNRVGGAAFAVSAFLLLVTLIVSLARLMPLPQTVADELDRSEVVAVLTDPGGLPQNIVGILSGDRVMGLALRIHRLTGSPVIVVAPGEEVQIPSWAGRPLLVPGAATTVMGLINRARASASADAVLRSDALDGAAAVLAKEMVVSGRAVVMTDGELRAFLNGRGIPTVVRGEIVAVAASPESAHSGIAHHRSKTLLEPRFNKVGVAVVRGSLGFVVVELFAG